MLRGLSALLTMPGMSIAHVVSVQIRPSPVALLTMLLILGASMAIFIALVRRETLRRKWVALGEWARSHGMSLREAAEFSSSDSPAFKLLEPLKPSIQVVLESKRLTLVQTMTGASGAPVKTPWNLLMLRLDESWAATGLRPTAHQNSFLDLFSLSSFPSLMSNERFMIFGTDSAAARALAESTVAAITPADVGLLLHGPLLILDFSSRHFDTIEFGRMIDLAEQLAPRLNAAIAAKK